MNITELLEANKGFAGKVDKGLLKELAQKGQKPIATIVSCSDSRVPVEVIFNQLRPGTFFVIRVAGNVISDSSVKGSIEYAIMHLKTPYLVVLGYTECGAVKAYLEGVEEGEILGLIPFFSRVVMSTYLGFRKPDPRIFAIVCTLLDTPPAEAVYIGNDPETDVKGARGIGMQAILLDRDGKDRNPDPKPDFYATNLWEAWNWIRNNFQA